jgi:hypothetical protein
MIYKICEVYLDHKRSKYIFTQPDLNLRQQVSLELIKDYDLGINYHPIKVNVVADAPRGTHLNMLATQNSYLNFEKNSINLTLDGVQIPELLQWKWIQHWSKIFRKDNLKMPRFKKLRNILRKIRIHDSV